MSSTTTPVTSRSVVERARVLAARVLPLSTLTLLATSSQAQETRDMPTYFVGPLFVTATRNPEPTPDTPAAVEVVDPVEVREAGQQTVGELLNGRAGVEATSTGGFGQPTSVFLRGANSEHTLVLVDGLRLGSATAGTVPFEHIPISLVERVEIVPGPLSSLYGSDAIGGVVQFYTLGGSATPAKSLSVGAGSYGTGTFDGTLHSRGASTDVVVSAGYFGTSGFDATRPDIPFGQHNADRDSYRDTHGLAKVTEHFDGGEVGAMVWRSDAHTRFDDGPTTDDLNHETLTAYSVHAKAHLTPGWESLLLLGRTTDDSVVTGAFPSVFRTDQDQLTFQNTIQVPHGDVLAGVDYLRQRISSDTVFPVTSRAIVSPFLGWRATFGSQGVQVNVRNDHNTQFGDHVTGALGWSWRLDPALRLRASVGTAFHAPTFNDLYYPNFSNPNLRPERSRSAEVGVDIQAGANAFSVTAFQNRIDQLIVFDPVSFTPENVDKARIRGLELGWSRSAGAWTWRADATVQNPVDEITGLQLQRRAHAFGRASASYAFDAWKVGGEAVVAGHRFDSTSEDPAYGMGGYAVFNLFASRRIGTEWKVEARVNNVFDRDYEVVKFYNVPGRNVLVTLKWEGL